MRSKSFMKRLGVLCEVRGAGSSGAEAVTCQPRPDARTRVSAACKAGLVMACVAALGFVVTGCKGKDQGDGAPPEIGRAHV